MANTARRMFTLSRVAEVGVDPIVILESAGWHRDASLFFPSVNGACFVFRAM